MSWPINPSHASYDQTDRYRHSRGIARCFTFVRPNEVQPHQVGAVSNPDTQSDVDPRAAAKNCSDIRAHADKTVANAVAENRVHESESDADSDTDSDVYSRAKRNGAANDIRVSNDTESDGNANSVEGDDAATNDGDATAAIPDAAVENDPAARSSAKNHTDSSHRDENRGRAENNRNSDSIPRNFNADGNTGADPG